MRSKALSTLIPVALLASVKSKSTGTRALISSLLSLKVWDSFAIKGSICSSPKLVTDCIEEAKRAISAAPSPKAMVAKVIACLCTSDASSRLFMDRTKPPTAEITPSTAIFTSRMVASACSADILTAAGFSTTDWVDSTSCLTSASFTLASSVTRMSLKVRSGINFLTYSRN